MNPFAQSILNLMSLGTTIPEPSTTAPQTPVGAGYYALQDNVSAAGIPYTKLVVAAKGVLTPSAGPRTDRPVTRRARRAA